MFIRLSAHGSGNGMLISAQRGQRRRASAGGPHQWSPEWQSCQQARTEWSLLRPRQERRASPQAIATRDSPRAWLPMTPNWLACVDARANGELCEPICRTTTPYRGISCWQAWIGALKIAQASRCSSASSGTTRQAFSAAYCQARVQQFAAAASASI